MLWKNFFLVIKVEECYYLCFTLFISVFALLNLHRRKLHRNYTTFLIFVDFCSGIDEVQFQYRLKVDRYSIYSHPINIWKYLRKFVCIKYGLLVGIWISVNEAFFSLEVLSQYTFTFLQTRICVHIAFFLVKYYDWHMLYI